MTRVYSLLISFFIVAVVFGFIIFSQISGSTQIKNERDLFKLKADSLQSVLNSISRLDSINNLFANRSFQKADSLILSKDQLSWLIQENKRKDSIITNWSINLNLMLRSIETGLENLSEEGLKNLDSLNAL